MLTYNLTSDIKQDGHLKIDIPTSLKNAKIELLIVVNPVEEKKIQKYDFSDLTGKLEWSGDAVSEQRKMRDEGNRFVLDTNAIIASSALCNDAQLITQDKQLLNNSSVDCICF